MIAAFALLVGSLSYSPQRRSMPRFPPLEYACDRFALEQTGDLGAFELAFGQLSESNLPDSDTAAPRLPLALSHTDGPRRVAAARRVAALGTVARHDTSDLSHQRRPIELELFPDDAPKTVENFPKLAGEGFYDASSSTA